MKKLIIALVLLISMLSANSAFAAWGIRTCTVEKTGMYYGNYGVWLTEEGAEFTNKLFYFHSSVAEADKNTFIAILLTAASTGQTIDANLNPDSGTTLHSVLLNKQ